MTDEEKRAHISYGGLSPRVTFIYGNHWTVDKRPLPAAAWKIKEPANDERTSLLVIIPPFLLETSLNNKLSTAVKKLAYTREPN
jgi:hypothetical protein